MVQRAADTLHQLTPEGFEEFVLYLLGQYELQLERVGGPGLPAKLSEPGRC